MADVLGAFCQRFGATFEDRIRKDRVATTRSEGLWDVERLQATAIQFRKIAVVDVSPIAIEDPSWCGVGRAGIEPQ
jgi:hypothetical protein